MIWPAIYMRRRALALGRKLSHSGGEAMLERLSKLLCEDPVISVAEFDGKFSLAAGSHLFRRIVRDGQYEPALTERCRELLDRNRDVVDVGANVGFHTVMFSKAVAGRRVLAVEPMPAAVGRLRKNIERNGVTSKVVVFEGVVSNAEGTVTINSVPGLEEYSSLGVMAHPSIAGMSIETRQVTARTLDQLIEEHGLDCGFLKIDVEGVEHLVLEGGQRTLLQHRPVILAELSDPLLRRNGSSAKMIVNMLQSLRYEVTDPVYPYVPAGTRDFSEILCVPRLKD